MFLQWHYMAGDSRLEIRPARLGDVEDLVQMKVTACASEPCFREMFLFQPDGTIHYHVLDLWRKWWISDISEMLSGLSERHIQDYMLYVAVDLDVGNIIGYTEWRLWGQFGFGDDEVTVDEFRKMPDGIPNTDAAFASEYAWTNHQYLHEYVLKYGPNYCELRGLYVNPRYQRRGIATQLLQPMLTFAQLSKNRLWIVSTSAGRRTYEKVGCVQVAQFTVPLPHGELENIYYFIKYPS